MGFQPIDFIDQFGVDGEGGEAYFVAYYQGTNASTSPGNATLRERLNTNFRFITHVPRVGIVTTLTVQVVWIDAMQNLSLGANRSYFVDSTRTWMLNPEYIIDVQGNRIPFTMEMAAEDCFTRLILRNDREGYFRYEIFRPYALLNLRVSKDMGRATVSFYANNFLNMEGNSRSNISPGRQKRNTADIYFGAEVRFRF